MYMAKNISVGWMEGTLEKKLLFWAVWSCGDSRAFSKLISLLSCTSSALWDPGCGGWELGGSRVILLWPCPCCAHPGPVQRTPNQCRTVPWAELMRSGETLAGGGQSGPSILGGSDGWSPDSNHRMRTGWRRSCLRPCCLASTGVPPLPLLLAPRCPQNSGFKKAQCFHVRSVQSFVALSPKTLVSILNFSWIHTESVILNKLLNLLEPQFPLLHNEK